MSYWDGGYVQLDVTDPTQRRRSLSDTDFAARRPGQRRVGRRSRRRATPTRPSSRATTSSSSPTDEDFDPFRVVARRSRGGPHAGNRVHGHPGRRREADRRADDARRADRSSSAWPARRPFPARPRPAPDRGHRARRLRLPGQARPGQGGGLHVRDRLQPHGRGRLRDAGQHARASTDIPAIFVSRTDGFRILGARPDAATRCDATAAGTGTATPRRPGGQPVDISAVFDGWGYTHMYKTDPDADAKMPEVDFYAPAENQDRGVRRGLRRHDASTRSPTDPDREPGLRLALRARHARPRVRQRRPQGGRRVRRARAAPTTGASRSTRWAARRTSSAPTATAGCASSSSRAPALGARDLSL